VFDVPCELDAEFSNSLVFSTVTELPELEDIQPLFDDRPRRFDDRPRPFGNRQRFSSYGGGGGYRFQSPSVGRRQQNPQRFSGSSYWKDQRGSRRDRDSLWDSDEE